MIEKIFIANLRESNFRLVIRHYFLLEGGLSETCITNIAVITPS